MSHLLHTWCIHYLSHNVSGRAKFTKLPFIQFSLTYSHINQTGFKYLSRSARNVNQLPAYALGTLSCKPSNFRKRVRKVISKAKWRKGGGNHQKMQWSEVKWSEVKGSKLWWRCEKQNITHLKYFVFFVFICISELLFWNRLYKKCRLYNWTQLEGHNLSRKGELSNSNVFRAIKYCTSITHSKL
jgi:hypothetical protein